MGYNDLSKCTLTPEERCEEAARITSRLSNCTDEMTPKERDFVSQMDGAGYVSILRDISDKY
jgi:hypothetical protein